MSERSERSKISERSKRFKTFPLKRWLRKQNSEHRRHPPKGDSFNPAERASFEALRIENLIFDPAQKMPEVRGIPKASPEGGFLLYLAFAALVESLDLLAFAYTKKEIPLSPSGEG